MKFVEASLVLPLSIMIVCGLIVMALNLLNNLYSKAIYIHEEINYIYSDSVEEVIRQWDEINEIFKE